jgi:cytochrome P450
MLPPQLATNFGSAQFLADPDARYAAWQRETPVFRNQEGVAYLTRHADCTALLSGTEFRRQPPQGAHHFLPSARAKSPLESMIDHWMLFMDPPRHDVVRQGFAPLFAAGAVERLEPAVRAAVDRLLSAMDGQKNVDLVQAFAAPLPATVICELLRLPQSDWKPLHDWSALITHALDTGRPDDMRAGTTASAAMRDYFASWISSGGLSGSALGSTSGAGEGTLQAEEVLYGCAFLAIAGQETTRNVLAGGTAALCERPAERRRLLDEPQVARSAVEELLRWTTPVQKMSRWTSAPARFGDYELPAGTLVTALVGAANRDPEVFADPQQLDLARAPNRHLAFSRGAHTCLGAGLARLELQIAFPALFGRFKDMKVVEARWRPGSALRSLERLDVSLG